MLMESDVFCSRNERFIRKMRPFTIVLLKVDLNTSVTQLFFRSNIGRLLVKTYLFGFKPLRKCYDGGIFPNFA